MEGVEQHVNVEHNAYKTKQLSNMTALQPASTFTHCNQLYLKPSETWIEIWFTQIVLTFLKYIQLTTDAGKPYPNISLTRQRIE